MGDTLTICAIQIVEFQLFKSRDKTLTAYTMTSTLKAKFNNRERFLKGLLYAMNKRRTHMYLLEDVSDTDKYSAPSLQTCY